MVMTYTSLVAPKGTAGSIANWVSYTKLDIATIVDEAQSLLYQFLRVREMRSSWVFGLAVGQSQIALPARFLDPVGRLFDVTNNIRMPQNLGTDIEALRTYQPVSGAFGANPFDATAGSALVAMHLVAHSLTQASTITIEDATAVGGLTLNGTFEIASITDDDNLVLNAVDEATSTATGGGSSATYTANQLISGSPSRWTIWDEMVKFDVAFETATQFKQLFFKAPAPLSATNNSNWVTTRYPMLMRKACQTAAADFMKDDTEYQKGLTALQAMIGSIGVSDDLSYRGAELDTDTPTPGDYY